MIRIAERIRAALNDLRKSLLTKLNAVGTMIALIVAQNSNLVPELLRQLPPGVTEPFPWLAPVLRWAPLAWWLIVQWAKHRDLKTVANHAA